MLEFPEFSNYLFTAKSRVRVVAMNTRFAYYISFYYPTVKGNFILPALLVETQEVPFNNLMLDHFTETDWLTWLTKNILLGHIRREDA